MIVCFRFGLNMHAAYELSYLYVYKRITLLITFQVEADNVGSKQMQQIRMSLRGHAVVLMGKNTMMRKAIRGHLGQNPKLELLLPYIVGNVGFVFTKEELVSLWVIADVQITEGDLSLRLEQTMAN